MTSGDIFKKPLQELAQKRSTYRRIYLCFHLAALALGFLLFLLERDLVVWVVPGIMLLFMLFYPRANFLFRLEYKKYLIELMCAETGFTFSPSGFLTDDRLKKHEIPLHPFAWSLDHKHEDGFKGSVAGIPFAIQEVVYAGEKYARRAVNNHPRGPFQARWIFILLRSVKRHAAHSLIVPDAVVTTAVMERLSGLKKVNIVSGDFEQLYDVLSTDQVESRAYLTPDRIEVFTAVAEDMDTEWLEFSLRGHDVLISFKSVAPIIFVPDFSLFTSGGRDAEILKGSLQRFFTEVQSIETLVHTLGLGPANAD